MADEPSSANGEQQDSENAWYKYAMPGAEPFDELGSMQTKLNVPATYMRTGQEAGGGAGEEAGVESPMVAAGSVLYPQGLPGYTFSGLSSSDNNYTVLSGSLGEAISYHAAVLCGISILSILANLFIFAIVLLDRKLRATIANVLFCHLGFLGLFSSTVVLPMYVSVAFATNLHRSVAFCVFQGYLTNVLTIATMLNLTAIAGDKYRTIAYPLRYSTGVTKQRLVFHFCIIWLTACFLSVFPAALGPGYRFSPAKVNCDLDYSHTPGGLARWVTIPILVSEFYIPGGVVLYCYGRIFRIARGHRKRITALLAVVTLSFQAPITRSGTNPIPVHKEKKASRTIGVFLGSFFLFYFPYSVISLVEVIFLVEEKYYLATSITAMYQGAPLLNAIVYGTMNKSLREVLIMYSRKFFSRWHLVPQSEQIDNRGREMRSLVRNSTNVSLNHNVINSEGNAV